MSAKRAKETDKADPLPMGASEEGDTAGPDKVGVVPVVGVD